MIPRSLKYNGETRITRTVNATLYTGPSGFAINGFQVEAMNIVFDPTSVTFWGSPIDSQVAPIPNVAEIAALYDRMKIDKVEMTWASNMQSNAANANSFVSPLRFLVCNDVNGTQGTALLDEIQQQPNKEFFSSDGSSSKWTCRPKYQRVVYQSSLGSQFEPSTGFINSNSAIPHYAIKMGITNLANGILNNSIDFSFKLYFSLKNVK